MIIGLIREMYLCTMHTELYATNVTVHSGGGGGGGLKEVTSKNTLGAKPGVHAFVAYGYSKTFL